MPFSLASGCLSLSFFHTLLSLKHRVEDGGFIRLSRPAHIQFSWNNSATIICNMQVVDSVKDGKWLQKGSGIGVKSFVE
jgi:hypothetical protein